MYLLNRFTIIFVLCSTYAFAFAQDAFMCDTAGIITRHDSVISYSCDYYYNYVRQSKDSVVANDSVSKIPVTFRGIIKSGKLNGPVEYLRNDSSIIQQGFMKNGLADSIFVTYHISMSNYKIPAQKSFFRNGLKDGEETEYNKGGTIIYIRNYKEGLLEGEFKHFDDFGNLLTSGFYKKGKKEEVWRENIIEKHYSVFSNYKEDELIDYNWVAYFDNGKTFFEGSYDKENQKQGLFKIYDTDGSLKSTETYKDGKRNGVFTEYYKGKAVRKIKYKDDKIVKD